MIEVQQKIEGQLAPCGTCGRQPHHYEVRGSHEHFLECSPCRMRTAKFRTLQEAVEAWEAQNTQPWKPMTSAEKREVSQWMSRT